MPKLQILLLAFAIIFLQSALAKGEPARQLAVFFAVDKYQQAKAAGWKDLDNPVRDAEAIAALLAAHYNFDTLIYRNPTKPKIKEVLAWLRAYSFEEESQLFLFFTGHGTFDTFYGQGYFVPSGQPLEQVEEFLGLQSLGHIATQINCKHILLAIDACYSGTIDEKIAFKSDSSGRSSLNELNARLQFLRNQWAFPSRLFVTSGGKNRTSDGDLHSPFAQVFINSLQNTIVKGDGFFAYQDLLAQLSRLQPVPHHGSLQGHENGGFVFVTKTQHNSLDLTQKGPPGSSNEQADKGSRLNEATGIAFIDEKRKNRTQAIALSVRAALTDAKANLISQIKGAYVQQSIQTENYGEAKVWTEEKVEGIVRNAQQIGEPKIEGGVLSLRIRVPHYVVEEIMRR